MTKVDYFRCADLTPPPGKSKQELVRYLDMYEHDTLDDAQLTDWVVQAAGLPGEADVRGAAQLSG